MASIAIQSILIPGSTGAAAEPNLQSGFVKSEFIYGQAPFPSCHASTIVETKNGLLAAWFGGTSEGNSDVGIWTSRHEGRSWSAPLEVANGIQPDAKVRYPCWNPVVFQPRNGPLLLFYKVGPKPSTWWGVLKTSNDDGKTWSEPRRLPEAILGPIKNKPIELRDGAILCPSSTEHDGWRIHIETTLDHGANWRRTEALNDGKDFAAIQPSILTYSEGRMQLLCRSKQGKITECWSTDSGKTWKPMTATTLPNPNSGIDALTLTDGRALVVCNHTTRGRSPLNVAISQDGKVWQAALVLEDQTGEYSYPAVIQSGDGLVHITYTWKRQRIKHAVVDPRKLALRPIHNGEWP
ncbi:MAG: sialidase family protein [Verrucomicrobiota bacterium]